MTKKTQILQLPKMTHINVASASDTYVLKYCSNNLSVTSHVSVSLESNDVFLQTSSEYIEEKYVSDMYIYSIEST